jgi:hypothetical protein
VSKIAKLLILTSTLLENPFQSPSEKAELSNSLDLYKVPGFTDLDNAVTTLAAWINYLSWILYFWAFKKTAKQVRCTELS